VSNKYKLKAVANYAITKCMSGNFKQALDSINVQLGDKSLVHRAKHMIKHACVLKKSSYYKKAYDLLVQIEADLDEAIQGSD
jgi:hypothetical protein